MASWSCRWMALLAVALLSVASRADDFRILSRVYVGKAKQPASTTTTLFHGGLVYDRAGAPPEVVVFDPAAGRFVMLDPRRKLRAEITVQQIEALVPVLRQKLSARQDELSAFLLAPQFETTSDDRTGEAEFASAWLRYRVKAQPARNDVAAKQYAAFTSLYTRLNALRHPPLLARATVNDWLIQRQWIPSEVRLTTYRKGLLGGMQVDTEYRSQHILTRGLSSEDIRRIEQIGRWLVEFRRVGPGEYWESKPVER